MTQRYTKTRYNEKKKKSSIRLVSKIYIKLMQGRTL